MTKKEAMERIARAVERDAPGYGEVGPVEAELGCARGYINKLRARNWDAKLSKFIDVLEALGLQPGAFFAQVFDVRTDPGSLLLALERPREQLAVFEKIEKATRRIMREEPPEPGKVSLAGAVLGDIIHSSPYEQRKRLRSAKKFRTYDFVRGYLEHLDQLRYEQKDAAAGLAETMAAEVVVEVLGDKRERLELQCAALGVFGSAHRMLGKYTPAAWSIRLGLEIARRYELPESTADLLQRGAWVLADHAQYKRAHELLERAQTIYLDLDSDEGLGKVLVIRGIMIGFEGRQDAAIGVFEKALKTLPDRDRLSTWHATAYHGMAVMYRQLRDPDTAERLLMRALDYAGGKSGTNAAKHVLLKGLLASDRRDYARAESLLARSLDLFSACDSPLQVAYASLDLISTYLIQGKNKAACTLANEMASLLVGLTGNSIAEGVVVELVQAGVEGKVNDALIETMRTKLEEGDARLRTGL